MALWAAYLIFPIGGAAMVEQVIVGDDMLMVDLLELAEELGCKPSDLLDDDRQCMRARV